MTPVRQRVLTFGAILCGFVLSFIALGVLWIGTPWPQQFLMCFAFFIAAYLITHFQADGRAVLIGAVPIGLLVAQFRDSAGSHMAPVLLVFSWAASVVLGSYVAQRLSKGRHPPPR